MSDYKLKQGGVVRVSDNACIPNCSGNRDWREYQEWLGEGNTPDSEFTLDERRENRASDVKQKLYSKLSTERVTVDDEEFEVNEKTQQRMMNKLFATTQSWNGAAVKWMTAKKNKKDIPVSGLFDIYKAIVSRDQALRERSFELREQVALSDNPESIDIESGW